MNKIQLKNFAIWARKKLIADIELKALLIGISEDGIQQPSNASTSDLQVFEINGNITKLSGKDIQKRKTIVDKIRQKEEDTDYKTAFNYIVEEVAYTWFNRLIAIRYMEINDYLPSRIRVLSSIDDTEPEILKNYLDADLNLNEKEIEKIEQYKEEYKIDDLFAFLFLKQCNALNKILPELFDNSLDYMEILLRIDFTSKDSVVYKLVNEVDKDNFEDVEVVGWLYQYYNTEKKEKIDEDVKKNIKITKETLPIKTQLFTPDWIVKYMVENSLGRLWLEKEENEDLKKSWRYYIEEAEQETEVKEQLEEIRKDYKNLDIEDIKIIDPCMGSGHMLTYTFDVFMQIYESKGYSTREAVKSIIENNIYGIELSKRAYQLAYFAIMMKARQYDSRVFRRELKTNLCYTEEKSEIPFVEKFNNKEMINCVRDLEESDLLGSLIETEATNYENLIDTIEKFNIIDLGVEYSNAPEKRIAILKNQLMVHKLLSQKYDVVITNPPYLGRRSMISNLNNYLEKYFYEGKSELYSAFILRCISLAKNNRYISIITIHSWMFISSFVKLRKEILENLTIDTMLHTGAGTFEELNSFNVLASAVCLRKTKINLFYSTFIRLSNYYNTLEKQKNYNNLNDRYILKQSKFNKIPNFPIAYWASEKIFDIFENSKSLGEIASPKQGLATADNDRFLRLWYEVETNKIKFGAKNSEEFLSSKCKYAPYNKGGNFRKWYGTNEYIINWENDGLELKNFEKSVIRNTDYYFKKGITWSLFGFENFGVRYKDYGFIFDVSGSSMFPKEDLILYIVAFLSSKIAFMFLSILAPTVNFQVGNINDLPFILDNSIKKEIDDLALECINISYDDWSELEQSFEFKNNYLCKNTFKTILEGCNNYEKILNYRYDKLKANEEKINELFIKLYNIENILNSKIEDRDIALITFNKKDVIKSFISYSVGCMLGRYSLDIDGLAFAGGEWDNNKYNTFKPVEKNCLLILKEEIPELKEYDIVNKFKEFVKVAFGKETLEENLQFIADALEIKGKDKYDVIRNYFVKDFYKEHTQMYKKCPIYWLFDAGKQNSFKALMYLHRYNTDTVGMINVEFLQKVQEAYERFKAVEEKAKIIEEYDKKLTEIKPYLEKMAHISNLRIDLDLDDGVKVNYKKLQTGKDGKNLEILAKIK